MGAETKIGWTQATWNPFHGCKKVSAGCKYCYMYRDKERYGQDPSDVVRSKSNFSAPLKWKEPKLIFTCSWSDWFIQEADGWRKALWQIIKDTPHHTYQILTKRPERIARCLPDDWGNGYPNVWLGISAEDKQTFRERMDEFAKVKAKVKFLSAEPLLEYFDLTYGFDKGINWVILGGESGNETGKYLYRECQMEWFELMALDCVRCDVPVFVKQLGTHLAKQIKLKDRAGADMDEFPPKLQLQQFPNETCQINKG